MSHLQATGRKPLHSQPWVTAICAIVGVLSIIIGAGIVLLTAALGHCSAFGGSCPGDPGLDWDVFTGVAMGTALAVGAPMFVRQPSRHRFLTSALVALVSGVLVGLVMAA